MAPNRRSTRVKPFMAYHEAGHAVAAWCLGIHIYTASVYGYGGPHFGITYTGQPRGRRPLCYGCARRRAFENKLIVSLAGIAAQKRFCPRSIRRHHGHGDAQFQQKHLAVLAMSAREQEAYVRMLQVRAEELVESSWERIEIVAKELLQRRHLTGAEIRRILDDACMPF